MTTLGIKHGKCPECGEMGYFTGLLKHRCEPMFEYHCKELHSPGEWETIRAPGMYEAALKVAAQYDQDDHSLMNGNDLMVTVRHKEGAISTWICRGEAMPHYYATIAETPDALRPEDRADAGSEIEPRGSAASDDGEVRQHQERGRHYPVG